MSATTQAPPNPWIGQVPPSPAGPLEDQDVRLPAPPLIPRPRLMQTLQFSLRQGDFLRRWDRAYGGDVFTLRGMIRGNPAITSHPDHVRSLFTAQPALAPSLTGESPLRPIVGPNSTLTALGDHHMRQRKLLLPPFHGDAVERYVAMISDVTEREINRWQTGREFQLAPRMQAITLDVIMSGIFGIEGRPAPGSPEYALRAAIKVLVRLSTTPVAQVSELLNIGRDEPVAGTRAGITLLDKPTYAVIRKRRASGAYESGSDILSMLLRTTTEDGEPLTDSHLRDELLTLVLAGHETTANSLAWTFERMLRTPAAYERLRDAVRSDEDSAEHVEAAIIEGMRIRPVIPIIGRRVTVPWRLGRYAVPADTPVAMSILLLHQREDLYPDPHTFRLERFLGHKPGTYEWIPFGGGIRRCLGATLAMAEQRVVMEAVMRRVDLVAPDPRPERAVHRNVTMIPKEGATVVMRARRP
ncbi:MAG: hypothetical protein QOG62_494 [Thermoleophilaceae bacterium]|nr:hypothetical protein [Thermoleophilaceae bacterium]